MGATRIWRGFAIGLGAAIAGLLILPGVAFAARPTREFAPTPPYILDDSCGYEILTTWPANNEYAMTFYDRFGNPTRTIITGRQVVSFTNTSTNETLVFNSSGTGHFGFKSGYTIEGRNAGGLPGFPDTTVFAGRIDILTAAAHGHLVADVCAALAP
jgi:hypothetical protein